MAILWLKAICPLRRRGAFPSILLGRKSDVKAPPDLVVGQFPVRGNDAGGSLFRLLTYSKAWQRVVVYPLTISRVCQELLPIRRNGTVATPLSRFRVSW